MCILIEYYVYYRVEGVLEQSSVYIHNYKHFHRWFINWIHRRKQKPKARSFKMHIHDYTSIRLGPAWTIIILLFTSAQVSSTNSTCAFRNIIHTYIHILQRAHRIISRTLLLSSFITDFLPYTYLQWDK